ncbi:MAG: low molecular weight protein arginine phosphatase [Puniceicoccaceae bacterium]|nr:MAG: low molecular weight protein arginine phosphatase [Puniceicoccaceae bacterium]
MSENRGEIYFVCTANICRSPMAARLMRHALDAEPEPLRSLQVHSAGLSALEGQPASRNSIAALEKVGLNLDGHRSRIFTRAMLDRALVTFVMTRSHLDLLELECGPLDDRVFLMRQFLGEENDPEIPDPYGMHLAAYEACRDSMVEAIPSLVRFLRDRLAPTQT